MKGVLVGGVLPDQKGKWISSYNRCLGHCLVFYAELCEILNGLNIVKSRNFENVLIQFDSMKATKVIYDCFMSFSNSVLIKQIRQIRIRILII